jgi:predicted SAM-dependent methyltransferase
LVRQNQVLDVGCGRHKVTGAVGLDCVAVQGVDVVYDLNIFPYPFPANTFDEIYARHVIEHLEDVPHLLAELHRVAKPGARLFINTPHYSYTGSWRDPTHRWHFSAQSFEYFSVGHPSDYYSGLGRYRIVSIRITMLNLWRLLGMEWLINAVNIHPRWRFLRRFWEEYLAFQFRAREIQVILEAVKDNS